LFFLHCLIPPCQRGTLAGAPHRCQICSNLALPAGIPR
jgi:hypothetical protein